MQETKTGKQGQDKQAFQEGSIMSDSKIEKPEGSVATTGDTQEKLTEDVKTTEDKITEKKAENSFQEKIVIPPRRKGEKPKFHGKTIKAHKKEDPIFNIKNILFVAAVMAIFGAFLFVVHRFSPDQTGEKEIIYRFDRPSNIFKVVSSGGTAEKIQFPSGISGMEGKKCLQLTYDNDADSYMGIGTIQPDMNNFKSISFRICSKHDRIFAVSVTELTGAVYMYVFNLKGGEWTDIKAVPSQFKISAHSTDKDGRLDINNLFSRLVIADMSGDRGVVGRNTMWIEKVVIEK